LIIAGTILHRFGHSHEMSNNYSPGINTASSDGLVNNNNTQPNIDGVIHVIMLYEYERK